MSNRVYGSSWGKHRGSSTTSSPAAPRVTNAQGWAPVQPGRAVSVLTQAEQQVRS